MFYVRVYMMAVWYGVVYAKGDCVLYNVVHMPKMVKSLSHYGYLLVFGLQVLLLKLYNEPSFVCRPYVLLLLYLYVLRINFNAVMNSF